MRVIKTIFGTLFALAAMAGCGYLLYMFFNIKFLPPWLCIVLMALCVVGMIAAVVLWIIFLSSLRNPAEHNYYKED